jgi:hypothetical protein
MVDHAGAFCSPALPWLRAPAGNEWRFWLVTWPVYGDTSCGFDPDIHRGTGLADKPEPGTIVGNYLLA